MKRRLGESLIRLGERLAPRKGTSVGTLIVNVQPRIDYSGLEQLHDELAFAVRRRNL